MPRKKTRNFGHPKNKDKRKDEEKKTKVNNDQCLSGHEESSEGDGYVESTEKFKQVEIPGKGQGLVATTHLPVGTTIIEESPLITAENNSDGEDSITLDTAEIAANFRCLSEEQKSHVLSLHDPGPTSVNFFKLDEIDKKVVRIFMWNCINLCGDPEMNVDKSGLYKTISRINHSCAPNVVWSWIQRDTSKSIKQVKVCRKIMEGEEILAMYCGGDDTFPCKVERQMDLKKWNFICKCEVCSLTGDELTINDEARRKIKDLHEALNIKEKIGFYENALQDAREKLKVMKTMKKEMILSLPRALMDCCELAAHCKLPSSTFEELMQKAKEMTLLHGDVRVYDYNKTEKRLKRIQQRQR